MDIRQPPRKIQQFRIFSRTGADPTAEFQYKSVPVNTTYRILEVTPPGPSASFECSLGNIEKVRLQCTHYSAQICRLVIGPKQVPRIDDPSCIHVSSPIQTPGAAGLQTYDPFFSLPVEMDLPGDFKYFTPYFYAQSGGGTGLIPYLTALGTPYMIDVTFFGR